MKPLTSGCQLSQVKLSGFKSIKECDVELGAINILIGCNGAGKSNFIGFFKMIQQILEKNLQSFVGKQGGPDSLLHFGRKTTNSIKAELFFGSNGYKFSLSPTQDNRLMFDSENLWWSQSGNWPVAKGHFETLAEKEQKRTLIFSYTIPYMKTWRVYHFHDTGEMSPIKQLHPINDNRYLRPDGQNLAAFLYRIKEKENKDYKRIRKAIQLVAPFFGDFVLRPSVNNDNMIELEWVEKGQDVPFKAHHLSDGTLRFICLCVALLQPNDFAYSKPKTIIVDEPELGLHPYAISVLASLLKTVSASNQIIVSTQSVELLNEFDVEDIIVVERENNQSKLNRLNEDELSDWLDEYSIGELWKKNILGGRPAR